MHVTHHIINVQTGTLNNCKRLWYLDLRKKITQPLVRSVCLCELVLRVRSSTRSCTCLLLVLDLDLDPVDSTRSRGRPQILKQSSTSSNVKDSLVYIVCLWILHLWRCLLCPYKSSQRPWALERRSNYWYGKTTAEKNTKHTAACSSIRLYQNFKGTAKEIWWRW